MDYKDTLNLSQSDFPMRGNLPQNEPKIYQKWAKENTYFKLLQNRKNATQSFNLHDGPPYANGHIHIGHALNKILKDIVVKYHYFQGHNVYYTPGWDCHGLPIEQQVEKKLGKEKKDKLEKTKIRELCRKHASEFIEIQKKEFLELGVIGDFENPYKTMDFAFEAEIYKTLCKIAKKGLLKERSKPVFWSWAAKSALAEAEVEYQDKEDYSIFVGFDLDKNACDALGCERAKAVIWTTTPWTLPSNQAICLNPNEMYVLTKENLIFAKPLLQSIIELGLSKGEILKEINAKDFESLEAINPLNGRKSIFILGEHVLMNGGSGLVHSAPGHGEEDYFACLAYDKDMEVIMPVDDDGCFDETIKTKGLFYPDVVDEFLNVRVFDANEKIIKLLGENLLYCSKFTHSYPFCWRTHEPVIYRATRQWFILMDTPFSKNGKTLREIALEEINKTTFYPEHGRNRIYSMIENRPDWCISRQRDWGVPIAFFRDKKSGEIILDSNVLEHIASIFEKEGCDAWWSKSIDELLPQNLKDRAQNLEKIHHILDVWFDSGSTWSAVLQSERYESGGYPASMYLEGSDQHRGWFQSSLLISCAINEKAPYNAILTHGFTMDGNGEKMSKSKGNTIAPQDILKNYGSEILRLWVALSDYQNDQRISDNILKQVSEQYRKIRNSIRFILANTNDFSAFVAKGELNEIDRWILNRANEVFSEANDLFSNYEFSKALNVVLAFISNELSSIYFDLCKDILYCDGKDSVSRKAVQSVLVVIANKLFIFLAPILTYSVNEAISYATPLLNGDCKDMFDLNNTNNREFDLEMNEDFSKLLGIRAAFGTEIDKLKKDKNIKSSLELEIALDSNIDKNILANFLIISRVINVSEMNKENVLASFNIDDKEIFILKSSLYKCPRCWRLASNESESLCPRCENVLKNI
ncbi:MAG: isoleucine--tRNA ligase [Helicobacteraceae bacterium]|nr:isoleucine--tRNA ligase [Helicobacteraceae bacterium]